MSGHLRASVGEHPDVAMLRKMLHEYMDGVTDYIINAEQAEDWERDKMQATAALDRIEAALRGTKP